MPQRSQTRRAAYRARVRAAVHRRGGSAPPPRRAAPKSAAPKPVSPRDRRRMLQLLFSGIILVVAIAMISVNIVKKSRAKAAAEHAAALGADGTDDIDEDALRLEILQEMLAERQKNREEQG